MRKEKMVTRTIVTLEVQALCVNIETAEVSTITKTINPLVKDEKTMLSEFQGQLDSSIKAVTVKSVKEIETLYGMTESDFIKYSKVLPPRKTAEN